MPWFLTPHGPHFVVEPGTVDEYERRDYVEMTAQQVTDYFAGVAVPDPPSFATEAEVPGIVAEAIAAGTGPVAEELRAALVASAVPADVAPRLGRFDPAHSIYTPPGARLRRTASKLAAVRAGVTNSRARITWLGHSAVAGEGATPGVNDAPVSLRKLLAERYPVGTGRVATHNNNPGDPIDDRWSFTGTWTYFGMGPGSGDVQVYRSTTQAGATATFTSDLPGTVVDIGYFGNGSAFTYAIDGGAAVTVTPNGATTIQTVTVTGLPNTTHTVVLTTTSTTTFGAAGVGVRPASAVEIDSLGFYGAFVADWLPDAFWNAYNSAISLAPDLFIVQLDGNEALASQPAATLEANLTTLVGLLQGTGADVALVATANPNLAPETWAPYRAAVYDVADAAVAPLVDINDRLGPHATADANGLYAADNVHLSPAGYAETALAVSGLFR